MVYLNSVNWGLIEPPAGHDDDDPSEFWKWTRGTNGKVCVDSLHPPLKFQHLGRSPVCSTCVPNSRCLRARDMSSVISKLTKSLSNTAGSWQVRFSCSVVVTKGILNLPPRLYSGVHHRARMRPSNPAAPLFRGTSPSCTGLRVRDTTRREQLYSCDGKGAKTSGSRQP